MTNTSVPQSYALTDYEQRDLRYFGHLELRDEKVVLLGLYCSSLDITEFFSQFRSLSQGVADE